MAAQEIRAGADGVPRCWWCGDDPLYTSYHDDEWGRPIHDEERFFGLLLLETFQAGLSWITILRKRETFRAAFADFDAEKIAAFDDDDRTRLMGDAGIIRNRQKIDAAIKNAAATLRLRDEADGLAALCWSYAPGPRTRRLRGDVDEIPAFTDEAMALSKDLKKRGFSFVGPTVIYAHMQSAGLVDDHIEGCHVEV